MIRVFPPSTIPHPWRKAFALVAVDVAVIVAVWAVISIVCWLLLMLPSSGWSFFPVES